MKNNEKIIILPKLNNQGGDLSQKWFVYYSCKDPRTGEIKRKKTYKSLHKHKTISERTAAADIVISELSDKLKGGFNPWVTQEAVYTNSIEYAHAATIFGRRKLSNKNFNYYANKFIHEELSGLTKETISTYTSRLRIFNLFLIKHNYDGIDITAINNKVVVSFFNFIIDELKRSGRVIRSYKELLKRLFEFIINDDKSGLITNPVTRIPECTRVVDKTPRPIKDCDLQELKTELMKNPQLWLACQFEYYCYMRPTKEIRLMQIKWIDFSSGKITIPKTIVKTKRDKIVTIPDIFLKQLIDEYKLNKFPRENYVFGTTGSPSEKHIGKNTLRRRFVVARNKIGMPLEYKLYSFKHTGNIAAKKAGIPLIERMWNNGHTSEKTTEIYDKNMGGVDCVNIKSNFPPI